jgi:hypothetical protein
MKKRSRVRLKKSPSKDFYGNLQALLGVYNRPRNDYNVQEVTDLVHQLIACQGEGIVLSLVDDETIKVRFTNLLGGHKYKHEGLFDPKDLKIL